MRITVRNMRTIAAITLSGAVIWAVAPYATSYVSSQAVVNAPLNTVLSPMRGRITQRSPPAGTGVVSGTPLVMIEVEERDRRYLEELRARLMLLEESLASIDAEHAGVGLLIDLIARESHRAVGVGEVDAAVVPRACRPQTERAVFALAFSGAAVVLAEAIH